MVKEFKEVLTPKERKQVLTKRARLIFQKEGILLVPKKPTFKQKARARVKVFSTEEFPDILHKDYRTYYYLVIYLSI